MIRKFNEDEDSIAIKFPAFEEKLFSKTNCPYTATDVSAVFRKVVEITDGIQISDSEDNVQNEAIEIDTIFEALDSDIVNNLGKLSKDDMKMILGEIKSDGATHGLTLPEFSNLLEEYSRDIFVMFGALLTGGHQSKHAHECENQT